MPFYLNDVPAEPFVIEPPETIELAEFTAAEAELIAPDAVTTDLAASIDDATSTIIIEQPAVSAFTLEGMHRLRVVLVGAPARQQLPDVRIIVQDATSEWHTLDTIREAWADAEVIPDALLWQALEVVKGEVLTFAPALAEGAPVPENYRAAQRDQLRNKANAAKVAPDGSDGQGDFILRPFPLDWHVKATLRPKRGIPVVA